MKKLVLLLCLLVLIMGVSCNNDYSPANDTTVGTEVTDNITGDEPTDETTGNKHTYQNIGNLIVYRNVPQLVCLFATG